MNDKRSPTIQEVSSRVLNFLLQFMKAFYSSISVYYSIGIENIIISYNIFFMVITIPFFLGINAWQANKCGEIRREIREIESRQENSVEKNKAVVAEIADLIAVDNLELEAQRRLGLKKMRPENIKLIIMGGKGREF